MRQQRWALQAEEGRRVTVLNRLRGYPPTASIATTRTLSDLPDPVLPDPEQAAAAVEAESPELKKALLVGEQVDRRVEAGLKIFRALLAADADLPRKTVDGKLLILFFYTDDAVRAIEAHPWPGNVRELLNAIKRAAIMAEGQRVSCEDIGLQPYCCGVEAAASSLPGEVRRPLLQERVDSFGEVGRADRLLLEHCLELELLLERGRVRMLEQLLCHPDREGR